MRDVFEPLPGTGRRQTVLLADGNVGLAGDPLRVLRRAAELMMRGGRCVAEVRPDHRRGVEQLGAVGVIEDHRPLVSVGCGGIDGAAALAEEAGLALAAIHPIGERVVATLAPT